MKTVRRTRTPHTCDRDCGHPIAPGDQAVHTTTPPGRPGLHDNPGWKHTTSHHPRCPIPGPTADQWNTTHPIGTPVHAWPGTLNEQPLRTHTRTPAWELGSGYPVVSVDGHAGGIHLTHIEPLKNP